MKKITFVTSNSSKFKDIKQIFNAFDPSIELEQAKLDLTEIQSLDINEVATAKAKCAWNLLKKPLLIDDGGIYIEKYNQFPGTLAKFIYQGIGLEGIWELAKDYPEAYFLVCLAYIDEPNKCHLFKGITKGKLIKPNGPIYDLQLPYTQIFIPQGSNITLAQIKKNDSNKYEFHRAQAVKKFLEWFNKPQ